MKRAQQSWRMGERRFAWMFEEEEERRRLWRRMTGEGDGRVCLGYSSVCSASGSVVPSKEGQTR
jgi:hypothetical protein